MNLLHRTARAGLARRVGVVMAAFALLGGGAALAQEGTPTFTPASEHEELVDPCETDPTLEGCETDDPTAEECLADATLEGCDEFADAEPTDEECLADATLEGCAAAAAEPTDEECAADATLDGCETDADDTRSETARAVHRALTATEDNPEGLSPGDEGFGQAVAANARDRGGNGTEVSRAARGQVEDEAEAGETDEELDTAASGRGNRPSHAGGPKR